MNTDVVIIGAGPGGYSAANRAAQLGLKTVVIEKEAPGGVCLNWGCIPTKSLLHSAHTYRHVIATPGITGSLTASLPDFVDESRKVATKLSGGIMSLFRKYGVEYLNGEASLTGNSSVQVKLADGRTETVNYKHLILASGASPRALSGVAFSDRILDSRRALTLRELPESILIVGGGAIGCEFADIWSSLGCKVTLAEMAPQILPLEEPAAGALLEKNWTGRVNVYSGISNLKLAESDIEVSASFSDKSGNLVTGKFDRALIAIGVTANLPEGADKAGIRTERDRVITQNGAITGLPNHYAIGDIIAGKQLAHKASHEGIAIAERIAGINSHFPPAHLIPGCIYTNPEIASIGYRADELKSQGRKFVTGEFPFLASGRALAAHAGAGYVKVYLDAETRELLGCHMAGAGVTELISLAGLMMAGELTDAEIFAMPVAHPTISEAFAEAIAVAGKRSVNY